MICLGVKPGGVRVAVPCGAGALAVGSGDLVGAGAGTRARAASAGAKPTDINKISKSSVMRMRVIRLGPIQAAIL
jgi:hypothetical protein